MKLNTDYWGNPKQNDSCLYASGNWLSMEDLILQGKPILNLPYDDSVCFGYRFKNPNSVIAYASADPTTTSADFPDFMGFSAPIDTGLFVAYGYPVNVPSNSSIYASRWAYGQSQPLTPEFQNSIRPVLKFDFRSVVWCCKVIYGSSEHPAGGASTHPSCDLYEFYHGTSELYKNNYIYCIYFVPYIGLKDGTGRTIRYTWDSYDGGVFPNILSTISTPTEMNYFKNDITNGLFMRGDFHRYMTFGICTKNYRDYYPNLVMSFCPYGAKCWKFVGTEGVFNSCFIGTEDDIKKMCANLGVFCATNENSAAHANMEKITDPEIIIGYMDEDGKVTDKILTGKDTEKTQQSTWSSADDYGNGFNGSADLDPNTYTDKIDLNTPTLSNVNVFNRSFAVNSTSVRQLADFLWNADETKFQEIVKGLALMGENPMNGIIDLRLFPFNVALKNSATGAENIVIGRTDTGVAGIKLTENVNSLIDLGECTFFTKFKNFLDYEPYTTAQLYIPYIGVVPVSTAEFMGHRISVKMIVDYTTGAGTAIVFKDDIPFIYRNGVVGITIPMTGTDSSTYANTVIGNVVSGVSQIATAGIGGATTFDSAKSAGGKIGAVTSGTGGIIGGVENIYSGFATPVQYQSASASSPSVATWQPQKCYFIIDRPILNVPGNYGRTVGYACEITGKLSDFKGFTVVSNPEINFKCTDNERQYMINMLQGGVFV